MEVGLVAFGFTGFLAWRSCWSRAAKIGLFALLRLSSRALVRSSRTRTHPLEKGGPPTKHANVEHATESGGLRQSPTNTSNDVLHFVFEFDDAGSSSLSYTIDEADKLSVDTDCDTCPVIYLNRAGCVFLAKLLLQMGLGSVKSGFHMHLGKNFDPEKADILRIVVAEQTRSV